VRWLVLLALSCSGQLEYEPGAYRMANPGTPAPAAEMPAPSTAVPPPSMPAPTMAAPPPSMPAPPPSMPPPAPTSTPPVSACPEGVDALALFTSRCGDCHDPQDRAKGLDLVSPGVAARLVGVKSTCNDKLLLDGSGATAAGHLLDKLRGPVAGCGQQMPYGMKALTPQELACVVEWSERAIARTRSGS